MYSFLSSQQLILVYFGYTDCPSINILLSPSVHYVFFSFHLKSIDFITIIRKKKMYFYIEQNVAKNI